MSEKYILKHIRFTQTQIDILDNLIKNKVGINNYSDAVRYAVLSIEDPIKTNETSKVVQRKLNAMSKNIDIIREMVAGGFHEQGVKAIGKSEDTYIYVDAKKNIEDDIQKATTIRSNIKKSNLNNKDDKVLNERSPEEIKPKTFSRNFY